MPYDSGGNNVYIPKDIHPPYNDKGVNLHFLNKTRAELGVGVLIKGQSNDCNDK